MYYLNNNLIKDFGLLKNICFIRILKFGFSNSLGISIL